MPTVDSENVVLLEGLRLVFFFNRVTCSLTADSGRQLEITQNHRRRSRLARSETRFLDRSFLTFFRKSENAPPFAYGRSYGRGPSGNVAQHVAIGPEPFVASACDICEARREGAAWKMCQNQDTRANRVLDALYQRRRAASAPSSVPEQKSDRKGRFNSF